MDYSYDSCYTSSPRARRRGWTTCGRPTAPDGAPTPSTRCTVVRSPGRAGCGLPRARSAGRVSPARRRPGTPSGSAPKDSPRTAASVEGVDRPLPVGPRGAADRGGVDRGAALLDLGGRAPALPGRLRGRGQLVADLRCTGSAPAGRAPSRPAGRGGPRWMVYAVRSVGRQRAARTTTRPGRRGRRRRRPRRARRPAWSAAPPPGSRARPPPAAGRAQQHRVLGGRGGHAASTRANAPDSAAKALRLSTQRQVVLVAGQCPQRPRAGRGGRAESGRCPRPGRRRPTARSRREESRGGAGSSGAASLEQRDVRLVRGAGVGEQSRPAAGAGPRWRRCGRAAAARPASDRRGRATSGSGSGARRRAARRDGALAAFGGAAARPARPTRRPPRARRRRVGRGAGEDVHRATLSGPGGAPAAVSGRPQVG